MDSLPFDHPQRLSLCLYATFKGNNDDATKGTEILTEMSKDLPRFTSSLIYLINNEQNDRKKIFLFCYLSIIENSQDIKTSASLALCTYLSEILKNRVILQSEKEEILQLVLSSMFSRTVNLSIKINLQDILDELFSADSCNICSIILAT